MNSKKAILGTTLIVAVIFNLLMFLLPINKTLNFWVVYVSSMISIILACSVFLCTLTKKGIQAKFNNLPLAWTTWIYFALQCIASGAELIYNVDYRTSLIINVIILGITAILLTFVGLGTKEIQRVDKKVKEKVFFIKSLQLEVDTLSEKVENENLKKLFADLSENIKYSDPMTHSALADVENKIEVKEKQLEEIIQKDANNEATIKENILDMQKLIAERNKKAKLYKQTPEPEETTSKEVNYKTVSVISVTLVVLIIIGITAYITVITPNKQYNEANKLLENKEYSKAEQAFEEMDGYKDSNSMIKECTYQYADELYKKSKYSDAINEYKKIPDYKDSNDKIQEATYEYAMMLYNNKEYSKSAEQFLQLADYKDSKDKVIEIYNLFGEKDVVYFGKYDNKPIAWQILDTKEHKVLLIAKECIDEKPYNNEYKSVNWENSSIREWLNEDFYNCFDENEKDRILKDSEKEDAIFLLSSKEIKEYEKLKNTNKAWWIAEKGENETKAMYVRTNGKVNEEGDLVTKLHGVRPCIWLDLD